MSTNAEQKHKKGMSTDKHLMVSRRGLRTELRRGAGSGWCLAHRSKRRGTLFTSACQRDLVTVIGHTPEISTACATTSSC